VSKALFDAFLLIFFSLGQILLGVSEQPLVIYGTGMVVSSEAIYCFNSIVLSLL
jgi:hypothetical protein